MNQPALYGITNSNRNGNDLWGKNQFNSSFPASLACYMRDKNLKAVYLNLDSELNVVADEIGFDEVFNTTKPNNELFFSFETKYTPYQRFAFDDIGHIDLVVKSEGNWARPLEVKLTVIPDSTTFMQYESRWGSEIVIRPATTSYCALGIADTIEYNLRRVREIFEPTCHGIQHWDNQIEISSLKTPIVAALDSFQREFYQSQKPFLLQPIWKTKGKSPILDDHAFDIFIWSDYALCRLFIERSATGNNKVNRPLRTTARLARILYEISCSGKTHIENIYTQMTFGLQSDKEFALSGKVTRGYMQSPRLTMPLLPPSILPEIILNGGEKMLSPERRFDQTIFFATEHEFGAFN